MADLTATALSRVVLVPITLFQTQVMAEPRAVQHISRTITARYQQIMQDPAKAAALLRKDDIAGLLELKGERPERIPPPAGPFGSAPQAESRPGRTEAAAAPGRIGATASCAVRNGEGPHGEADLRECQDRDRSG